MLFLIIIITNKKMEYTTKELILNYRGDLFIVNSIEEGLELAQYKYDNAEYDHTEKTGRRMYCFIANMFGYPVHHQYYYIEDGKFVRRQEGDIIETFESKFH